MKMYIVIVLDYEDGPYTYNDSLELSDAECSASEARHELPYNVVIRCVELDEDMEAW